MSLKSSLATVQISKVLSNKIRFIANVEKRSIRKEIEYLIEKHIAEFEKKHGKIDDDNF